MTRKEIKLKAKSDISGRTIACFIPIFVFIIITNIAYVVSGFFTFGILSAFVSILLAPMEIGVCKIYLDITLSKDCPTNTTDIFSYYRDLTRTAQYLVAYIVKSIYIILGFIFLIIPGIFMLMRYSMVNYILAENPDMKWRDALKQSKEITKGHCFELFVFYFSYIGWYILSLFTMFLLLIWVLPYQKAAEANYYRKFIQLSMYSEYERADGNNL